MSNQIQFQIQIADTNLWAETWKIFADKYLQVKKKG